MNTPNIHVATLGGINLSDALQQIKDADEENRLRFALQLPMMWVGAPRMEADGRPEIVARVAEGLRAAGWLVEVTQGGSRIAVSRPMRGEQSECSKAGGQ